VWGRLRRWWQGRRGPLTGAPAVRRVKTYAAESGYVYEYFFCGRRAARFRMQLGTEYVFSVSVNRRAYSPVVIFLPEAIANGWEAAHQMRLTETERYAVAKMRLFRAFDQYEPARFPNRVVVSGDDLAGILEVLGIG